MQMNFYRLFAINKDFFTQLGLYDPGKYPFKCIEFNRLNSLMSFKVLNYFDLVTIGFDIWGGENLELSFKVRQFNCSQ
jgi:hypothetical protein